MKKRVKLLTTIASLCLAVALMAFGVYAANNLSGSVTTKVSFTATANVKALVQYSVKLENATDKNNNYAEVTDETWEEFEGMDADAFETLDLKDLDLDPDDGATEMTYEYTIKITNNATAIDSFPELQVTLTQPTSVIDELATKGYKVECTTTGFTSNVAKLGANAVCSYTVKITIKTANSLPSQIDLGSSIALVAQVTSQS